ncbi:bifunctional 2',3'-cyclic-nucleotide 2'-phosphodiesterase/3'-nucleotidase [Paracoccus sediminis]|uniref:2',3'-cyclic-nucleotide 2'-phosphodiesterase / 3'-nucleotidase n=1 Tax=Paracoccus sediminis TaxID=1214787 RepID=A0A238XNS7_9RHOB|nr:bifunctional 2',3'-cyclic-nucleotide 2'-phosphodiesterase/3'-nucleotidase [Paracoccus sediminis]TBN48200.1 bifunctional 2',3'-cyclic-nucleotide 2'-phosphodiesterase/3'-nucleotidase [Paracoccus sediminis]SNR60597.1 2',3'-cyclic-nucleotide 2'-phosphodiesterase / 3'-nucleotidase [Paracoccus sediminis]
MPDGTSQIQLADLPPRHQCDMVMLRILATTDMHMKLLPHDYLADRPCGRGSLAQIASLVERHRHTAPNTLLLDNGDFLQGTPLGDLAAQSGGKGHPAIAAMNLMGYDAAAIGNHDFAFGLDVLRSAARQARFPLLAANLSVRGRTDFPAYAILRKRVRTATGRAVTLRIGLVGFLPPQTAAWDLDLAGRMACDDILATARRVVPRIRAEGADIVVALAHSGISAHPGTPGAENVAAELGALDGVDAIVAGHTHEVFPGSMASSGGIDAVEGTLSGKPAVMPGFCGSHLGVMDLSLVHDDRTGWRLSGATSRCEAVGAHLPPAPAVLRAVAPSHRMTVSHLGTRVGSSAQRISSYFTLIGADPALTLVNMAQRWFVRKSLQGTALDGVPVLAAAAPFRAGGRGGPQHFTDVAAGRLRLGNLTDIYSFSNRICAVSIDGAGLRGWLERSAGLFNRILPGRADQPLTDPAFPAYQFDVIEDLRWRIDLSSPAAFRADGTPTGGGRVRDLTWRGRALRDDDRFVLATNSYRLSGCGLFAALTGGRPPIVPPGPQTRDVIRNYLRQRRRVSIHATPAWQFQPLPGTSVTFETGPRGIPLLPQAQACIGRRMEHLGHTGDGFAVVRLHL